MCRFLNVAVNVLFLSIIAYRWPGNDYRSNRANLAMHIIFLFFSICTLLLNPGIDLTMEYFTPRHVNLALLLSQACLVIYMLHVIIGKVRKVTKQTKAKVKQKRKKSQGAAIMQHVRKMHDDHDDSQTVENPTFDNDAPAFQRKTDGAGAKGFERET